MPKVIGSIQQDREFPQRSGHGLEADREYRIALANMQAERMLQSENPPIQVVMHHLRMDSAREREEIALIQMRTKLAEAEVRRIEEDAKSAEAYSQLMETLARYQGRDPEDFEW